MVDNETNEGMETADDSAVIKTLRNQVKKLEAQVGKATEARQATAQSALEQAGYPKLVDVYLNSSEEFPTADSVSEFLGSLGLQPQTEVDNAEPETDEVPAGDVASLSQRVASAAADPTANASFDEDFASATTPAEIAAVMAKHGMSV